MIFLPTKILVKRSNVTFLSRGQIVGHRYSNNAQNGNPFSFGFFFVFSSAEKSYQTLFLDNFFATYKKYKYLSPFRFMYIGDALLNKKYIEKTYCLIRCPSCPCFTLRHFEIEKTATYAYMYTSRNRIDICYDKHVRQ